jgi:hydrogenase-1 operon protein HyaF
MRIQDIPIVATGRGSQPTETDGAELDYIALPKDMNTYRAPAIPEPDEVRHLDGARSTMAWLRRALTSFDPDSPPQLADLSALDDESRSLVNQILGEGEVSIKVAGEPRAAIQEAVLAGVWRIFYYDASDRLLADLIEVAAVPRLIRWSRPSDLSIPELLPENAPVGVMNGQAILTELAEHCASYQPGDTPHAINVTLLPLSPEDIDYLDVVLGRGPVDILSRGYGDCQVISTRVPNVWWVRYFNSMGTQILNSLEVTDIPAVACAAPEDLVDSDRRLASMLEPYWPDDAELHGGAKP